MKLKDLKTAVNGKIFVGKNQIQNEFIPPDTLRVGDSHNNLVKYEIYENNNSFYLKHNDGLGINEDLRIDVIKENPLSLILTSKFSNKYIATWTEQENSYF